MKHGHNITPATLTSSTMWPNCANNLKERWEKRKEKETQILIEEGMHLLVINNITAQIRGRWCTYKKTYAFYLIIRIKDKRQLTTTICWVQFFVDWIHFWIQTHQKPQAIANIVLKALEYISIAYILS